jgi:pre-mRNA-processing factor 19
MTTSPDTTIRVWNIGTCQTTLLLRAHDAPVTGLSLHPTGDYLLSSSLDQHWAFSDIRTGRLLTKVSNRYPVIRKLLLSTLHFICLISLIT